MEGGGVALVVRVCVCMWLWRVDYSKFSLVFENSKCVASIRLLYSDSRPDAQDKQGSTLGHFLLEKSYLATCSRLLVKHLFTCAYPEDAM